MSAQTRQQNIGALIDIARDVTTTTDLHMLASHIHSLRNVLAALETPTVEECAYLGELWVAVTGNLSDGFSLYHGFADGEHAEQWAQEMGDGAHTMTALHYTT